VASNPNLFVAAPAELTSCRRYTSTKDLERIADITWTAH
jgi:hypothetical protein